MGEAYSFEQALGIELECAPAEAKPELMEQSTITAIEEMFAHQLATMQVDDRMDVLCEMALEQKLELLAFCTASQITSSDIGGSKGNAIDVIGQRAGLDISGCWQAPTAFFARLTKPVLLKLLAEHCGAEVADNCRKLKRAELAEVCADRLVGTDYLPPALRLDIEVGDEDQEAMALAKAA